MHLLLTSINHKHAPIEVREHLSFTPHEAERALGVIGGVEGVLEVLLLSTCNRTELLVHHDREPHELPAFEERLQRALCALKRVEQVPPEAFSTFHDLQAANHLFRVVAGLESVVIGETQILGQVKDSYALATRVASTGVMLNRLMHKAFRVGKRAQAETGIGSGISSVSHAAAELAARQLGDLTGRRVLIVGAGQMAHITAKTLARRTPCEIVITNRTAQKGRDLALTVNGSFLPFGRLAEGVAEADLVVAAVSTVAPLVTADMIPVNRGARVLIDIGVPRNIAADVECCPEVTLFDVDDLRETVAAGIDQRRAEVSKVEAIIDEELEQFENWFRSLAVEPTIKQLISAFEKIGKQEVQRVAGQFSDEQQKAVEAMASRLINKILHKPICHLKTCHQGHIDNAAYWIEIVNQIFDLDGGAAAEAASSTESPQQQAS